MREKYRVGPFLCAVVLFCQNGDWHPFFIPYVYVEARYVSRQNEKKRKSKNNGGRNHVVRISTLRLLQVVQPENDMVHLGCTDLVAKIERSKR